MGGGGSSRGVTIRALGAGETQAISRLILDAMGRSLAADYTPAELLIMKRSFSPEGLVKKLEGADAFVAVAADGEPAGIGARIPHESRDATSRLRALFVAPEHHRHGVGSALVRAVEERARTAGDINIRLASTRTAVPFYRRLGYVVTEQPPQPPPTYLQMGKHLLATIRPELPADAQEISEVILDAFEDGTNEVRLVDRLRREVSPFVSMVAVVHGRVVGHVALSPAATPNGCFVLGPLAIRSAEQRTLLGTALCRAGIAASGCQGARIVCLFGCPQFYARLGFVPAAQLGFAHRGSAPPALMVATPDGEAPRDVAGGPLQFHPAFDDV